MKKNQYLKMSQLSLLIAVQLILTFSSLGFIRLGPVHLTLMHIPVIIGTLSIGLNAGVLLGTVFGISSMINATLTPTPDAIIFSPIVSKSFYSVILAMLPRILLPIIVYYIFKLCQKSGMKLRLSSGVAAAIGTVSHTIMVLGLVYLLFGKFYAQQMGIDFGAMLGLFLGVLATNGLAEAALSTVVTVGVVPPLRKFNHS